MAAACTKILFPPTLILSFPFKKVLLAGLAQLLPDLSSAGLQQFPLSWGIPLIGLWLKGLTVFFFNDENRVRPCSPL